uniref:Uncharacterized protein n=1 Tax=Anguilla anguilla TaxID=7936 RepID=A0A0E9U8A8_ANGAN
MKGGGEKDHLVNAFNFLLSLQVNKETV